MIHVFYSLGPSSFISYSFLSSFFLLRLLVGVQHPQLDYTTAADAAVVGADAGRMMTIRR